MEKLEERCINTCDFFYIDDKIGNLNCKKDCSNNIKKHIELKNKSNFILVVTTIVFVLLLLLYLHGIYYRK